MSGRTQRTGVSYAHAPLGTRPAVYFAYTGDGRVKKVNRTRKRRRKKKNRKSTDELVLQFNKLFPAIDLSVVYACVLQYTRNEALILKQLTAYSRAEQDERTLQKRIEELRETFPATPTSILRRALEQRKMDVGEASVWIVENGHVETVSSRVEYAPSDPAVPFIPPSASDYGPDPRESLALTQTTVLTDITEELEALKNQKGAVMAALRALQARVQGISELSQSFEMLTSTLHEDSEPRATEEAEAEEEGEFELEEGVEWESDDEDVRVEFEGEEEEESGEVEPAEVVDAPVVRIEDTS